MALGQTNEPDEPRDEEHQVPSGIAMMLRRGNGPRGSRPFSIRMNSTTSRDWDVIV